MINTFEHCAYSYAQLPSQAHQAEPVLVDKCPVIAKQFSSSNHDHDTEIMLLNFSGGSSNVAWAEFFGALSHLFSSVLIMWIALKSEKCFTKTS